MVPSSHSLRRNEPTRPGCRIDSHPSTERVSNLWIPNGSPTLSSSTFLSPLVVPVLLPSSSIPRSHNIPSPGRVPCFDRFSNMFREEEYRRHIPNPQHDGLWRVDYLDEVRCRVSLPKFPTQPSISSRWSRFLQAHFSNVSTCTQKRVLRRADTPNIVHAFVLPYECWLQPACVWRSR